MTWSPDSLDWRPQAPRLRPVRLVAAWLVSALALICAAQVLPGVAIDGFWGAVAVAAAIALLNAFLPPLVAALRLPATLITGLLLLIALNALMIQWAADLTENAISVDGFGWAVLMALVTAAFSVALSALLGIDDDDTYALRVTRRIARRQGHPTRSDAPGILFLEIDGLAAPVLRQAMPGRQRADHGALADRRVACAVRVGDRPLVADRRQPGRHPARLQRRHPRVPLGREGARRADDAARPRRTARRSSSGAPTAAAC